MLKNLIDYYSIWPFFASVVVVFFVARLPILKVADIPPVQVDARLWNLDGLRGFLALAVVFNHIVLYHRLLAEGVWSPPPTRFYSVLGAVGVSTFFMITGYLFWSALLRQDGTPNWSRLYIGRLFRIGPLYLLTVLLVLLCVLEATHFSLQVSKRQLLIQLSHWFSLGLLSTPDVNGYKNTSQLLFGVTWSIQWEWGYYLALPFIAFICRKGRNDLIFICLGLIACLIHRATHSTAFASKINLFLLGMLCASLQRRRLQSRLPDVINSTLALVFLFAVFVSGDSSRNLSVLLLGGMFYLICSGCTLFGLLLSKPSRRLGDISYGIYLLQGLVLTAVYHLPFIQSLVLSSAVFHWLVGLVGVIVLVLTAAITHVAIEVPGVELGRRLAARTASREKCLTL